jgi:glycosyltransferase involved in cell wall biosynthesis
MPCEPLPFLKVLHTIASLHAESGGPSRSVPALCEALVKARTYVELVCLDRGAAFSKPITCGSYPITFVHCRSRLERRLQWSTRFKGILRERCHKGGISILHDTGMWLTTNHSAASVSRELRLPRIVSARGMLTPWAMRFRGFKKWIAWIVYQRVDLQHAAVLHATCLQEALDLKALGFKQPIAVIPNGVSLPPSFEDRKTANIERRANDPFLRFNRKKGIRQVLFLSRIHPKKGLLDLVEAWQHVKTSGWQVLVAGGDESGHMAVVKEQVTRQGSQDSFEFIGQVADGKKWELYLNADLFVLPSRSENFGLVIAEALSCGLPVITTQATPWEELRHRRCGWWVELGGGALAEALNTAMRLSDAERRAMGFRGRELVEENYTWPAAAKKMVSVYQWMLGLDVRPRSIV